VTVGPRAADPVGAYLDTNAIIDVSQALGGAWNPSGSDLPSDDRQRLAAARIFFYSQRTLQPWHLTTSSEAIRELHDRSGLEWVEAMFTVIDRLSGSAPVDLIEAAAAQLRSEGIKEADALHLAHAALTPWLSYFVTNDKRFLRKAKKLTAGSWLRVLSACEAEAALAIGSGAQPPIAPHPTNPLAQVDPWWIP
jgi:hypothetical protein